MENNFIQSPMLNRNEDGNRDQQNQRYSWFHLIIIGASPAAGCWLLSYRLTIFVCNSFHRLCYSLLKKVRYLAGSAANCRPRLDSEIKFLSVTLGVIYGYRMRFLYTNKKNKLQNPSVNHETDLLNLINSLLVNVCIVAFYCQIMD